MTASLLDLIDDGPPAILHQSDRAVVIHANALDYLPDVATESVDLIVTDPPYRVDYVSGRRSDSFAPILGDTPEDAPMVAEVLRHAVRIVGQNRHLYVFGPVDVMADLKVAEPVALVWDKGGPGMGDLAAPWGPAHEPITFATSKHRHAGEAGKPNLPTRLRKGTVLRFAAPTGTTVRHPSEKPTALLRELIESSSRADDLVVDPFGGIGSTGVAAIVAGRRTLIIERHGPYARVAADRVAAAEAIARQAARL